VDAEVRDPVVLGEVLQAARAGVEVEQHQHRVAERHERAYEREHRRRTPRCERAEDAERERPEDQEREMDRHPDTRK
jgi:hypothetical protein